MAAPYPAPFEAYVAPARRHPELWRLGLGIVLIVTVNFAFSALLVLVLMRASGVSPAAGEEAIGQTPGVLLVLLFAFSGLILGSWLAVRLLHRRSFATLIGHAPTALRHFVYGAALIGAIQAAAFLLAQGQLDLEPNLDPRLWLLLLPLALVGLVVQTGAEELVFRGYLQQQLAARFASPWIWMVLPSLAFGLLHYEPTVMGPNTWVVVGVTGVFGLIAADLTARSGTLGLAWGLHFANNIFALTVVAPQGALSGLALYTTPFAADDAETMRGLLLADVVLLAVIWGLCRLALRRR